MVVGVVLDDNGRPLCCMWPGNTTDVTTLIPVVEKIRDRFNVSKFCVVADRGMISKEISGSSKNRKTRFHTSSAPACATSWK